MYCLVLCMVHCSAFTRPLLPALFPLLHPQIQDGFAFSSDDESEDSDAA